MKFVEIMQGNEEMLMDRISDKNALHVILWSNARPDYYVIFDGVRYYWVLGTADNGWDNRVEFKIDTSNASKLKVLSPYDAVGFLTLLPFKVRKISLDDSFLPWTDYLAKIN